MCSKSIIKKKWYQNCENCLSVSDENDSSISIVIPSYNSKKTIIQCLESVLNQSYRGSKEVIVVDSSNDGTDDLIRELFPDVILIHLAKKTFPGAARNMGVRTTRHKYIAFTDTDCVVDYHWLENAIRRIEGSNYDAVGGSVINGTPESISGTLGYLNEFSFYLPGIKTGFVSGLATANVCYNRSVFDKLQFMEMHFAGEDTVFHWAIENSNGKLFFDRTVKVKHKNRKGFLNVLKHQHKMGEGAGIARIVMKRDLVLCKYPIFSLLLLPWIRVLKMYHRVFIGNRKLWKKIVLFSPLSLIIAYSWGLGFFQSLLRHEKYEQTMLLP